MLDPPLLHFYCYLLFVSLIITTENVEMFGGDEGLKYAGSRATRVSTRPIDVFFEKLLLVGISSIYLKSIV